MITIIIGAVLGVVAGTIGLVLYLRRRARRAEQPSSPARAATLSTITEIYKRRYPLTEADRLRAPAPPIAFAGLAKADLDHRRLEHLRAPMPRAATVMPAVEAEAVDHDLDDARRIAELVKRDGLNKAILEIEREIDTDCALADLADRVLAQHAELTDIGRRVAELLQVRADLELTLAEMKRSLVNRGMPALERVTTYERFGAIAIGRNTSGHYVLWKTHTPTEAMFVEPADMLDLGRAVDHATVTMVKDETPPEQELAG